MYLVQLIYASQVSEGFGPGDIESILEAAQHNNTQHGVTGLLCFSHNNFLQCLEGSRQAVNEIYQKILKDERHHNPVLLHYDGIKQRNFVNWAMGYVGQTQMISEAILKYSGQTDFDPFKMSGPSAQALMVELAQTIPVETGLIMKAG